MPQIAGVLAVMEVTVDVWPGVVSALAIVVNHAAHVVKETKNFRAVQTNQKIMVRVKKKMIRASLVKETAVDAAVDVDVVADIMDVVVVDRDLKEWDRKSWKEITR